MSEWLSVWLILHPRPDQRAEREASIEQRPFEAPAAPDEIQAVDLSLEKERRLLPSKEVQDLHKLTHLPPAEWCTICVRSRARDDCHHRQPEAERKTTPVDEFPVVQADHTTLGDQTVLSIVYTGIKGGAATVVMSKSTEDYVVSWFLARFQAATAPEPQKLLARNFSLSRLYGEIILKRVAKRLQRSTHVGHRESATRVVMVDRGKQRRINIYSYVGGLVGT